VIGCYFAPKRYCYLLSYLLTYLIICIFIAQVKSDEVKACDQAVSARMNAIFLPILVAATVLSEHVSSYKILVIPLAGKSHIFSLAAIAEGLTERGHGVTFFVGDGFRLNEAAVKDWAKINVVRYKDSLDGVPVDYDRMSNNMTRNLMEQKSSFFEVASLVKER